MYKAIIGVIIILIILIIIMMAKEHLTVTPTMLIMPELDEKCQAKYGPSAFYDVNVGECYSCSGTPRNPSANITSPRGCMGVTNSAAITTASQTCREQYGNDVAVDILTGECYRCSPGYSDPSLVTKKCSKLTPASYTKAYIGRSGVGPDGLAPCAGGYTADGNKCWKCGTGFIATVAGITSTKKCCGCTSASSRKVQTCDQEFANNTTKNIYGDAVKCGPSTGCDWTASSGGRRRCFCCPEGYVRTWDPVYSRTACVRAKDNHLRTVHWLRECEVGGWPKKNSGETLAGGKYWKCPGGYAAEAGTWEDPKKCCKYQGAMVNTQSTCKDTYGGKTISGVKYSNEAVGWDVSGKCFACPDGYVRTADSVYGTNACVKTAIVATTPLIKQRDGISPEGWKKCAPGYSLDILSNKCWKCPTGLAAQLLEHIDSNYKCIAQQGPHAGTKMGKY